MQHILDLLKQHGYIVLFISLILELIAFPTPGEALMTYSGFLVYQGKLNWALSILVAFIGVSTGITISYTIGRLLGMPFFNKYGHYIHFGPDKLDKTSKWFGKYGNKLLIIAYFIPGVRHVTGYFSGITGITYKKFAFNSYLGAFIWTGTFISLGKILGSDWEKFHTSIKKYLIIGGIISAAAIILIYAYRNYRKQLSDFIFKALNNSAKIFNSLGKMKLAIIVLSAAFLGFCALVIGLIQDFLAHEFNQFDMIVSMLSGLIFSEKWANFMKFISYLTSPEIILAVFLSAFIFIYMKKSNRHLEIRFLFVNVLGGELLEKILRLVFHRQGPPDLSAAANIVYTFPGEHSFAAVIVYGFTVFILLRYLKKTWLKTSIVVLTILICIFSGITPLFFHTEYPSDVAAGYVFGGLWLSLNIILLEIYRILPRINFEKDIRHTGA